MDNFLFLWPGQRILLVWGVSALQSVRAQCRGTSASPPKPQRGNHYGIVLTNSTASTTNVYQLYGGEPVLVINAQMYTYKEMSSLFQGTFTKRTVYVASDVPYWHHSFSVQEHPFAFTIEHDAEAARRFCCSCMQVTLGECSYFVHDTHPVCFECMARIEMYGQSYSFDGIDCYHASHKREYVDAEEQFLINGFDLPGMDHRECSAGECVFPVDEELRCTQCDENGYCSLACLQREHVCLFIIAPQ